MELDRTNSYDECWRLFVFPFNKIVGSEGLCPSRIVFGAISTTERTSLATKKIATSKAVEKAREDL